MIMPSNQARLARPSYRLSTREKWILGGVAGLVAALIVVLLISIGTASHKSSAGCVDIALPYSTGGADIYRCGAAARAMCASVGHPSGYNGASGRAVAAECRKAGIPVG